MLTLEGWFKVVVIAIGDALDGSLVLNYLGKMLPCMRTLPCTVRTTLRLLLRRVHNNLVNIRTLNIKPIPQPPNCNLILPLRQIQHQWRTQNNALVCVSLEQSLHTLRIAIHNHTSNTSQLPSAIDAVGRATGLVAETHVVGVLIVEGHPLGFAAAFNAGEGCGGVVAIDTSEDDARGTEGGFLGVGGAGSGCSGGEVGCAFDGSPFAGFATVVGESVSIWWDVILTCLGRTRHATALRVISCFHRWLLGARYIDFPKESWSPTAYD